MNNFLTSTPGKWLVSAIIGGVMGFLVYPLVASRALDETANPGVAIAFAIIGVGIARLAMDLASRRQATPATAQVPAVTKKTARPVAASRVDTMFGAGKVTYTVKPSDKGDIVIVVTAKGLTSREFKERLLPLLQGVGGMKWERPVNLSAAAHRQALRRGDVRREAVELQETATPDTERTVSGVITRKASLQSVVANLETLLGMPQEG